jgi:hypothetical protein
MSGDWLKFEKSTSDKPEVWAMAEHLSIDPDAIVGKLLRVWGWFDEQSEEGNAPIVSKLLLDRRVGVSGFCDSMVLCGWMIEEGNEVMLPNFDRHNGKTAKNRSLTAKRVANHKQKTNAKGNGVSVTNALPREEKRREEIKPPISPKGESVPFQEIVNLYHKNLPMLPKVVNINETRKRAMKARWAERVNIPTGDDVVEMPCNSIDFWDRYFRRAAKQPFLIGESCDWNADFDFLLKKNKFIAVVENKYLRD